MFKDKDWWKNINYVLVSLVVYIVILALFFLNFSWFLNLQIKTNPSSIREGLLLPQVDGVETLFNVDPLVSTSKNSAVIEIRKKISSLLFSTLFRENTDGGLDKDLVKSYSFKDAKDLTITIRDDAKWSDGKPVTADDIAFTINIIRSLGQDTIYSGAANSGDIDIIVLSDTDLKITLEKDNSARPNAGYIYELVFPILPKHILSKYTKPDYNNLPITEFGKNPITSGPYLYNINRIDELNLIANENYYNKKTSIYSYDLKFFRNYSDLLDAFKLRNIDFFIRDENLRGNIHKDLVDLGLKYSEAILRDRKLALYFNTEPKSSTATIFNNYVSPRRALLHAINRQDIYKELGVALRDIYGPIDQKSWAFSDDVLLRNSYDPTELEKSLKILGYEKVNNFYQKDGKDLILKITYLDSQFNDNLLNSLKSQIENLGIHIKLEKLEAQGDTSFLSSQNSYAAVVNNRDFDILLTYVDKNLDPDVYAEWHSSSSTPPGLNFAGFNSRVADRTLSNGRILANQNDRKSEYLRFQKAFYDESTPALFLFNPSIVIYYQPTLNPVIPNEINLPSSIYNNITDWSIN